MEIKFTPSEKELVCVLRENIDNVIKEYSRISDLDLDDKAQMKLMRDFSSEYFHVVNTLTENTFLEECSLNIEALTDKQKYFFLHIPRCGGTSIKRFMKENNIPRVQPISHLSLEEMEEGEVGRVVAEARPGAGWRKINEYHEAAHVSVHKNTSDFFSYGAFCRSVINMAKIRSLNIKVVSSIRNPYDWLASYYFFGAKNHGITIPEVLNNIMGCGNVRSYFPTFKDFFNFFVQDVREDDPLGFLKPYRKNPFFQLYDENNRLIVDDLIKLETIEADIQKCFNMPQNLSIPKVNDTKFRSNFKSCYDAEMKNRFEKKYGFLLEEFGYGFE
jgi:hypothetical protein